jgi:hypothetical protein
MCTSSEVLKDLCNLFPQTAENIKKSSLERRLRFIERKNANSRAYIEKKKESEIISIKNSSEEDVESTEKKYEKVI